MPKAVWKPLAIHRAKEVAKTEVGTWVNKGCVRVNKVVGILISSPFS